MLRKQIGLEIEQFAVKGYEGALTSDNPNILATATYIREALFNAAYIARGIAEEE